MVKTVFISHADREVADHLEKLIRNSFPGIVEVFNSSRSASGLAPGEPIDSTLKDRISSSSIMVWLATPKSVTHSFWMAWELGVASAMSKLIFPCRALGLPAEKLPLLQSARFVPDLGSTDDLTHFLHSLYKELGLESNKIAEEVNNFKASVNASVFDSRNSTNIAITMAGTRLIIENRAEEKLLDFVITIESEDKKIVDRLQSINTLDSFERKVLSTGDGFIQELKVKHEITFHCRWRSMDLGRHYQNITLHGS